jgi:hypothetical protein
MCNCGDPNTDYTDYSLRVAQKEKSKILNKWILDDKARKLLIVSPIYDSYNDILGYVTKTESGEIARIFIKNIKKILE